MTLTIVIGLALSCSKDAGEPSSPLPEKLDLEIVEEHLMDIDEPSGLSYSWNEREFLVVSDNSNTISRINEQGKLIEELSFKAKDLEGVTYQEVGKTIWAVDEKKNKLYQLNKLGGILLEYELSYDAHP